MSVKVKAKKIRPPYPGCTEKNNFRLVTTETENPLCDNPLRGQVLSLSYLNKITLEWEHIKIQMYSGRSRVACHL